MAVVLLVLGIIMGIVYANLDLGITDDATRLAVKNASHQLELHKKNYEFKIGTLPENTSLEVLTKEDPNNPSWRPVSKEVVLDPWKRPYFICRDDNGKLQICSYGADGQPGGEGTNQDFKLTDDSSWPAWLKGGK